MMPNEATLRGPHPKEFKPGFELVPEWKPKIGCVFGFHKDGQRFRCTDGAVEDSLYCARHKAQKDAERARAREARMAKLNRKWWQLF